jgi:hypothetical protein
MVSSISGGMDARAQYAQESGVGGVDDGVGCRVRWLAHVGVSSSVKREELCNQKLARR